LNQINKKKMDLLGVDKNVEAMCWNGMTEYSFQLDYEDDFAVAKKNGGCWASTWHNNIEELRANCVGDL
jgi:hypothetical protein